MMRRLDPESLHAISLATKTRRCTLPLGRQNLLQNTTIIHQQSLLSISKKRGGGSRETGSQKLGYLAHVLRKGVAGLAGVGETFQELVVDST